MLKKISVVFLTLIIFGCASQDKNFEKNSADRLPIVQGLTNATATQISIVAPVKMKLTFRFADNTEKARTEAFKTIPSSVVESDGSNIGVHHLEIQGLNVGRTYTIEVLDNDGRVIDRREFHALDVRARPARVASGSCMYDFFVKESRPIWKALIDAKPDLVLLLGDNVYAETGGGRFKSPLDEKSLWIRYNETFQVLDFYKSPTLIPTLTTWDDHDYGMRDGDRTNPNRLVSKKVHDAFFAQTPSPAFPEYAAGPGVSSKFDAFGYRFLLLDDRSFRSPNDKTTYQGEETHFGDDQEQWILTNVKTSASPVWLISGDQWFGGYHRFESYEGNHPASFKKFLKSIANQATVLFMSGDRHLSEVMRIEKAQLGYETYEITSSPLHSTLHASGWDKAPNSRQIKGIDLHHNFNLLLLTPASKTRAVHVTGAAIGADAKPLYTYDLNVTRSK